MLAESYELDQVVQIVAELWPRVYTFELFFADVGHGWETKPPYSADESIRQNCGFVFTLRSLGILLTFQAQSELFHQKAQGTNAFFVTWVQLINFCF